MSKHQYIQFISRVFLLIINGILIYYFTKKGFIINTIGLSLLLIFQLFLLINYIKKQFDDIEKSIDCLLYDDYTNSISKLKNKSTLHKKTALLQEKQQKHNLQNTSEKLIFTNIIESLSFGVLILKKDSEENLEIIQVNKAFSDFLKIPKLYNWKLLEAKIGQLADFIKDWKSTKHTVSIVINNESESFFLKTSVTKTNNSEYLILSIETIQQLIDKKEKEAWYKLMNVMSHEIINTITPISSLAENLDSLLHEKNNKNSFEELSEGLQIIKRRSTDLTSFVDTYRKLAELPLPKVEQNKLFTIVNNVIDLYKQEFLLKKISYKVDFINEDIIVNVDKEQIEQVLINLLSNSVYALEKTDNPTIHITLNEYFNRINLSITDNGIGIPNEIKDNIFTPYFTTRKNGSGIGLTLSKSIMEAHNGKIVYVNENNLTKFTLVFIQ